MFFSNFSWVHMFCNDNHSKLVPESMHSVVSWVLHVKNLHEKRKSKYLIIEWKVGSVSTKVNNQQKDHQILTQIKDINNINNGKQTMCDEDERDKLPPDNMN